MIKEIENMRSLSVVVRAKIDNYRREQAEEGASNIRYVIARCLPFDNQEHN